MKVLILGGDGYLGWPTALHLSAHGMNVCVVDNYLKRKIWDDNGISPLIHPEMLDERTKLWSSLSNRKIFAKTGDVTNFNFMKRLIEEEKPDSIVHYAEQPSAPFSMRCFEDASLTLKNNLLSSLVLAYAVNETDKDIHIIKLGTMGEYGTPNIDIEEGFIDILHKGRKDRLLFPRQGSSLYHTTKIQDTDLLYLYVRIWGLRVTDLMQGPVYGIKTNETQENEKLFTAFNYDELFGTVLNRFIVQAITDTPLTVYGSGNQERGFLNLVDTLECVKLAIQNPAKNSEMRILNQFTETFSVNAIANLVANAAKELGINAFIEQVDNPRIEKEDHYYNPQHTGLLELGLQPNFLTEEIIFDMLKTVQKYAHNIDLSLLKPKTTWK